MANSRQRDCVKYSHSRKKGELLCTAALSVVIVAFLAYFFYRSVWAMIPLAPIGAVFFRTMRRKRAERAKEELKSQFRECILSVSALLQAGYSAENAFVECGEDMKLMYGEGSQICGELSLIRRGLNINISLEELIRDFARRSSCEEISQFARIFSLAKRNGGNMAAIIRSSAALIGKQIELRREIQTMLSGKRMELNIMKIMPFGILLYINISNPGYFDGLYHNLFGIAVMTGCLTVYLAAYSLGELVMDRMTASI